MGCGWPRCSKLIVGCIHFFRTRFALSCTCSLGSRCFCPLSLPLTWPAKSMDEPAPSRATEIARSEPLLPALLLNPTALLWLWWLPLAVLLLLNWEGYQLIEGNMDEAQHRAAIELGLAGAGNFLAGFVVFFALRFWLKRNPAPVVSLPIFPIVGAVIVLVQVTYLWFAVNMESQVLPA